MNEKGGNGGTEDAALAEMQGGGNGGSGDGASVEGAGRGEAPEDDGGAAPGSDFYDDEPYDPDEDPEVQAHFGPVKEEDAGAGAGERVQGGETAWTEAVSERGGQGEAAGGMPREAAPEAEAARSGGVVETAGEGSREPEAGNGESPGEGAGPAAAIPGVFGSVGGELSREAGVREEISREIGRSMDVFGARVTQELEAVGSRLEDQMKVSGSEMLGRMEAQEQGVVGRVDAALESLNDTVAKLKEVDASQLLTGVASLEKLLRVERADATRDQMAKLARRQSWMIRIGAVLAPAFVAGGMAVPVFLPLPLPLASGSSEQARDATNGWKDVVWEAHGRQIAKCIEKATKEAAPVRCPITARAYSRAK